MRKRYQPRRLLWEEPKQKRRRSPLILLGYLVLITSLVTSFSFSRYASTASSKGAIKVARPVCVLAADSAGAPVLTKQANGAYTAQYPFTVTNTKNSVVSDVTMRYTLTITIPNNFEYTLTKNGSAVTVTSGTYTDQISFGTSQSHRYILYLTLRSQTPGGPSTAGLSVTMKAEQKLS